MADATDLKSVFTKVECGFESRRRHFFDRRASISEHVEKVENEAGTFYGMV
jgi:hypothetical protein